MWNSWQKHLFLLLFFKVDKETNRYYAQNTDEKVQMAYMCLWCVSLQHDKPDSEGKGLLRLLDAHNSVTRHTDNCFCFFFVFVCKISICSLKMFIFWLHSMPRTTEVSGWHWSCCVCVQVRKFIMSPIKDPRLELALVMFIVPLVVNVSQCFLLLIIILTIMEICIAY